MNESALPYRVGWMWYLLYLAAPIETSFIHSLFAGSRLCNFKWTDFKPFLLLYILDISSDIMMTTSNGNIFRVTGPLWGESTCDRWFPITKASDAELWCLFDLRLNKRLSKQSIRRCLETPLRSLWHHYSVTPKYKPLDLDKHKPTPVHIMSWCREAILTKFQ